MEKLNKLTKGFISKNSLLFYLFFLFLLIRLVFIFTFPPFIDESNYIEAGKISLSHADFRFWGTEYWGKEALPIWLFGFFGSLTDDPIIGARIFVLFASSVSFFYLFFLTKSIFSRQVAVVTILLYALCPGFIIFNSLLLQDSLLLALNIIILYYLFKFKENFSVKESVALGFLLSLLVWIKATSIVILGLTATTFVFFFLTHKKFSLKKIYLLIIPSLLFVVSIYLLSVQSDLSLILEQTSKYSGLKNLKLSSLGSLWLKNILFELLSLMIYLSPLVLLSFLFSIKKFKSGVFIILTVWIIAPLIFFAIASESIKARYFIFSLGPFLPILGFFVYKVITSKKNIYLFLMSVFLTVEVFALVFVPNLFFALFPKQSLLESERDYAYSWPSGYGVREALTFFEDIHPKRFTFLVLHDHPSNLPTSYTFSYYFNKQFKDTKIIVAFFDSNENVESLIQNTKTAPTYFISNSIFVPQALKPYLKLIKGFEKPGSEDFIGIYKLEES